MLSQKVAVYVPSTDFETAVTQELFTERIQDTEYLLSHLFGGATTIHNAYGSWLSDSDKLISENIAIVYSWSDLKTLIVKANRVLSFTYESLIQWQQYSIALEIASGLYFIDNDSDIVALERKIIAHFLFKKATETN